MRKMSRRQKHQRTVKRAWLAAHKDARREGLGIAEAQILAEHAARKMGAALTRLHRRKQLRAAVEELQRAGAIAPERTPARECNPPRHQHRQPTRKARRRASPEVRARRNRISARDRARAQLTAPGGPAHAPTS